MDMSNYKRILHLLKYSKILNRFMEFVEDPHGEKGAILRYVRYACGDVVFQTCVLEYYVLKNIRTLSIRRLLDDLVYFNIDENSDVLNIINTFSKHTEKFRIVYELMKFNTLIIKSGESLYEKLPICIKSDNVFKLFYNNKSFIRMYYNINDKKTCHIELKNKYNEIIKLYIGIELEHSPSVFQNNKDLLESIHMLGSIIHMINEGE